VPGLADILSESGHQLQLGSGDDDVDVVAHRPAGPHLCGPPTDQHRIGNGLVDAVENRPAPVG
jgi:hypothetical protein